jgi:acyl-CoA synthetase (AMP-forming)/AMP-acid ligase II
VVGHNDEQALEAHVVPVDSDLEEEFLENELRLACASRLGLSLQPRWYCFHEELPATLIGVVDYRRVGV